MVEPLIFEDKILQMAYNKASFHLKMMLSSEFLRTKFLLLIDYLQKPRKFHIAAKISGYKVVTHTRLNFVKRALHYCNSTLPIKLCNSSEKLRVSETLIRTSLWPSMCLTNLGGFQCLNTRVFKYIHTCITK